MCKIMEEYSREEAIDATIDAGLKFQATTEQIAQMLEQKYGLDSETALSRIDEFKKTA